MTILEKVKATIKTYIEEADETLNSTIDNLTGPGVNDEKLRALVSAIAQIKMAIDTSKEILRIIEDEESNS